MEESCQTRTIVQPRNKWMKTHGKGEMTLKAGLCSQKVKPGPPSENYSRALKPNLVFAIGF